MACRGRGRGAWLPKGAWQAAEGSPRGRGFQGGVADRGRESEGAVFLWGRVRPRVEAEGRGFRRGRGLQLL